jgi:hypothetical protein
MQSLFKERIMDFMNRFFPIFAAVLLMLSSLPTFAADDDVSWIADSKGCKIANPFPQPGESVTWSGGCKNGLADGEGMMEWFINGKPLDKFEGMLKDGWAEGKGTLIREGGRYAGDWKHSLQDGNGRFDAPDGSWYEGEWKEGQPHGSGKYQTPDGRVVTGTWEDGVFQGDMDEDDNNPNKT